MCVYITLYLPFINCPSIPLISPSWMLCYFVVVAGVAVAAAAAGVVGIIATVKKGMMEFLFVHSLLCSLLLLPRLECVRACEYLYICFVFFYVCIGVCVCV